MATAQGTSKYRGLTGSFRIAAYVEAVTYLVLLVAVIVKRVLHGTDLVPVFGPIHGMAFLAYLVLVLRIRESQGWDFWRTIVVVLASAVPFGGFWAARDLVEEDQGGGAVAP